LQDALKGKLLPYIVAYVTMLYSSSDCIVNSIFFIRRNRSDAI